MAKKKTRASATNTDLPFSPDSTFCVDDSQQNQEKEDQTTDEEDVDNIEKDPNFEPIDENDNSQSEEEFNGDIGDDKKKYYDDIIII